MPITVSPTQSEISTAIRAFLLEILPAGVEVIASQINRVPEPSVDSFVVMTPLRRERLKTNIDAYNDVTFNASIVGDLMTVASVESGTIEVGAQVFGTGLATGTVTTITGTVGGTGGVGTYRVSPSQIAAAQEMAAGRWSFMQSVMLTTQLDVYGPDSADNAQVISTLWRDPFAVDRFAVLNSSVSPLYADDPTQSQFVNEQQQYQERWIVEAAVQADQTVSGVPVEFADSIEVTVFDVEAEFPV